MSSSTRDRILDEAMRLFAERGYRGTSVAQIELAAGLSPGSGGLYHHFDSKDAVLAAAVARHLSRLDALRDIRKVFSGLGDLRSQLVVMARYCLAELDSQTELLQLLASEARRQPDLLTDAVDQLLRGTYESFAEWLAGEASIEPAMLRGIAFLGLGSLLSSRLTRDVLGTEGLVPDDDELVETWAEMMMGALRSPKARRAGKSPGLPLR